MKKILLVCTGNTCRSSMAEALLKKLLSEREDHLKDIAVSSAGTYAIEGDKASPQAEVVMKEMGLSLKEHRSTPLTQQLIQEADLVITMTLNHKISILQVLPEVEEKVFTLKEFVEGVQGDISDPYGQTVEVYRNCANEIEGYLNKMLEKLERINKEWIKGK